MMVQALEGGSTLLQVGCGNPEITIPLMSMGFREVSRPSFINGSG